MALERNRIEHSSLQCGNIEGNNNEVFMCRVVNNYFADVPREDKETLQKGQPEIMSKNLAPDIPDDTITLAVEGAADGLALYEHFQELAEDLKENEKDNMIGMFCLSFEVEPRPANLQQLFERMVHMGKLRLQDFTYLQCLLWKVGRRDLFEKMAEKARAKQELHQNDKPPLRISHLDVPDLQPVNGYSYVKFHLQVDILDINSERLRNLRVKLARLLSVPQEYIAVVGVEPDKSAWVTVIMPTVACEALKWHIADGGLQNFLHSLGIDKVGFFPEPLEDSRGIPFLEIFAVGASGDSIVTPSTTVSTPTPSIVSISTPSIVSTLTALTVSTSTPSIVSTPTALTVSTPTPSTDSTLTPSTTVCTPTTSIEIQAEEESEEERDFQVFVRSGTPTERYWGGGRVVFCTDRDGMPGVKRSEGMRGRHPETAMLVELQEMLTSCKGSSLEVTVFQNASPCASCSQKYVQLVNKASKLDVDLKLHVVFVALYKVRRPSRAWRPTYSVLNLPQEVHRQNVRGLQSLRNLGVELRVFGFPDWQRLRQLLGLLPEWQEDEDYTGSVLERENGTTARDLQRLLVENVESDEDEEEEEDEDNMQLAENSEEDEDLQPVPNADPAEPDSRVEFLMFWDSGLHGVHWRRGARALYVIDGQEVSDVFINTATDADHHAETYLLQDLKERLMTITSADIDVTVYQNLSPCGSCCVKYENLLEFFRNDHSSSSSDADGNRTKNIKLTIVFARFYNIRRPSCAECNLHSTPFEREHHQGVRGLLRLRDRGVVLHCFQEQDWVALHQHLQVPGPPADYASSRRKLEDDLMAADAKKVFGFDLLARAGDDQVFGGIDVASLVLFCYYLFGWRLLVISGILVTQSGMTWACLPVLRTGERASLLLLVHAVQICLSLCLAWMLYPLVDWRET